MLFRLHPRSFRSNTGRLLRLLKNWDGSRVDRLEISRRFLGARRRTSLFRQTVSFLSESQYWSAERLKEYQERELSALLRTALKSPYYRRYVLENDPGEGIGALRRYPFLTRRLVDEHRNDLVVEGTPEQKLEYFTTGGSTAEPMGFFLERGRTNVMRDAFFARMWGWVGYRPWSRGAILRGIPIDSDDERAFFDYNVLENKLLLSSYHIKPESLQSLYAALFEFMPFSIQAYPSALTSLSAYIVDHNLPPPRGLGLILCGSENIYPWQRHLFAQAFSCRVYSWYGHSENVLLAGECERSSDLHVFSEHGIIELIRPDGSAIEKPGEVGEIVGTGFLNSVMPFIRYRTGDLASYASGPCACGRAYPRLSRVDGRLQEILVTKDGRLVSMTAINMHDTLFDNVQQYQFEQFEKGKLTLRLIRKSTFSDSDLIAIESALKSKIGSDTILDIQVVDRIPVTKRGKHRFLIQHLEVAGADK